MDFSLGILIISSYIAGSIPFGKMVARRIMRIDISSVGSGNIGATNVAREIGLKWGFVTLVLDCLKGWAPAFAAEILYRGSFNSAAVAAACGLAALIGHQFSIFLRFDGGKGVATALGFFLVLCPSCVAAAGGIFVVVVYVKGYVSLASICAAGSMPLLLVVSGAPVVYTLAGLLSFGLISWAHRGNIMRLIENREPRWTDRCPK